MDKKQFRRPIINFFLAAFICVFGIATIKEGGAVLFYDSVARAEAGNYVPFVLWFNYLAGFFYVITGIGIFFNLKWASKLSLIIASGTLLTFLFFIGHIFWGGLFELRTIIAMILRSAVWIAISYLLLKNKKFKLGSEY